MKKAILLSTIALFMTLTNNAQNKDKSAIKKTILAFSQAGDNNDADKLAACLDDNYRVVMNRLFGSDKVSILTKEVYLEKIRSKAFGGDNRKVNIESIELTNSTAMAKVSLVGSKATFISLFTLIKNENNEWKLISDVPIVK